MRMKRKSNSRTPDLQVEELEEAVQVEQKKRQALRIAEEELEKAIQDEQEKREALRIAEERVVLCRQQFVEANKQLDAINNGVSSAAVKKTSGALEKHPRTNSRRTNSCGSSCGSSSEPSTSSKSARCSDARWPSGESQSSGLLVRLADALGALRSAKLVTVAEIDLASAQFRRYPNNLVLRIFLESTQQGQVQIIRKMLANPTV